MLTPTLYFVLLLLFALPPEEVPQPPRIVNATLHQFEDGPPAYAGHRYIAGETVFFSFQVADFRVSPEKKVHLSYRIDAMDSEGILLTKSETGKVDVELAPQDKEWMPRVRRSFVIPPHALPGEFKVTAAVTDELSGREATSEVRFVVDGRRVEPSKTLVVRNFRFLRREEDTHAMPVAAYRPGDRLWARFDITGFKIAERNHIHVDYGLAILDPSDEVLYSEPLAATEEDSPFYPKRHVPSVLSLSIQPGTPAGEYILLLTTRDTLSGQTYETRQVFRVE